jgi:rubrerythrin
MRNRMMKKMSGGGGGGMFGSLSSPFSGNTVNYYCMSCGTKHKEASCPKCGSKMKRVG